MKDEIMPVWANTLEELERFEMFNAALGWAIPLQGKWEWKGKKKVVYNYPADARKMKLSKIKNLVDLRK